MQLEETEEFLEKICEIISEVSLNMGIKIIDLGYSTTPSVEVFIEQEKLDGGIMISASHNGLNGMLLNYLIQRVNSFQRMISIILITL